MGISDEIVSCDEIGKRLEGSRLSVGRAILIARGNRLPFDVGRLHDLGIEHEVSVDVVDAIEVGAACSGESGVEATVVD